MRTPEWRITRWVKFNYTSNSPDWADVVGLELYDHRTDTGATGFDDLENANLAGDPQFADIRDALNAKLAASWDQRTK